MVRAAISPSGNDFLWNLEGNVGRNSPNKPDDVDLVRYGYFCMGKFPSTPPGIKPLIAQMKSSGGYGADLQAVIDRHEADRGGPRDGYVSKLPPGSMNNNGDAPKYDAKHTYILATLTQHMRLQAKDTYPRLDREKEVGAALATKVKDVFRN